MTFVRKTFVRKTFGRTTFVRMAFDRMTFARIKFGRMAFSKMTHPNYHNTSYEHFKERCALTTIYQSKKGFIVLAIRHPSNDRKKFLSGFLNSNHSDKMEVEKCQFTLEQEVILIS
jgi:hypothetical protein